MNYDINPCKACWQKYNNGDCNINDLNDCLVDTATAFSTFPSNNSIGGTLLGQNWKDCIAQKLAEMPYVAGKPRSFCNFQLNMAPRLLDVPHFYPKLLEDTKNQKKALAMCHKKCEVDCRQTETCKMTCNVDHNAVENFSVKKKKVRFADLCSTDDLNGNIPGLASNCLQNKESNKGPELVPIDVEDYRNNVTRPQYVDYIPGRHGAHWPPNLNLGPLETADGQAYASKEPFASSRSRASHRNVTAANSPTPTFLDEANAHPASFWVPFTIIAILLSLVLLGFGMALFSRKFGK